MNLSKLGFNDLRELLIASYYACDHITTNLIRQELETRFSEELDELEEEEY